ncbi:cathepsin O-like [Phlebotomus argentipes]|uniref:cathepsin O-like n=1 Tax=Phlebotomus argentipes TaxID=94469 RepID=UPI0028937F19|nr:cathepsin O-like [Phlebotomus argentipes]
METGKFFVILGGIICLFFIVPLRRSPPYSIQGQFERFVSDFDRPYRYHPEAYENRFLVFEKSMVRLKTMNESHWKNPNLAKYGVTNFTDLTIEEFQRNHLGYRRQKLINLSEKSSFGTQRENLPKSIDWRSKNYVTKVKNQGACGACWAYSVLGVVETMVAKRRQRRAQDLSIQQIFDCFDTQYFGCHGGDFVELLQWTIDEKIPLIRQDTYNSKSSQNCTFSTIKGVKIKDFTCRNFLDNEDEILYLLATHGPLVAAINGLTWQNYLGGIIQHNCDGDLLHLNHVVEIVGYNLSHDTPHYIVRNSWGRNFGEDGYVRIAIGKNLCGIAQRVAAIDIENSDE